MYGLFWVLAWFLFIGFYTVFFVFIYVFVYVGPVVFLEGSSGRPHPVTGFAWIFILGGSRFLFYFFIYSNWNNSRVWKWEKKNPAIRYSFFFLLLFPRCDSVDLVFILSVCLSVCLFIFLHVCLHLYFSLSLNLSNYLFICPSPVTFLPLKVCSYLTVFFYMIESSSYIVSRLLSLFYHI